MTKNFENRVKKELTVDTKTYRYVHVVDFRGEYIKRIRLDKLNTTEALDNWEIVKRY